VRRVRLRLVAEVNPATREFDRLPDDVVVTFLALESVWPGSSADLSVLRTKSEVATGYTRFREGDILVPKITPTFQANRSMIARGLLGGVGAGTTELHVVRPSGVVDPRYLLYSLSSRPFLKDGEGAMYGVAGQKRVPEEFLRDWPVLLPGIDQQRAIADYLDAETARIDQLVEARLRLVELIEDRRSVQISNLLEAGQPTTVRRVIRLCTSGPRGWGDLVTGSGYKFIRSANLSPSSIAIDEDGMAFVQPAPSPEADRSRVRMGDILVGITGANTGRVGLVGAATDGAYVSQHVAILRPDGVIPELLAYAIASDRGQRALLRSQYGGTKTQLGLDDLRELEIHVPGVAEQRRIVVELDRLEAATLQVIDAMARMISMLQERRQALITAAVTGQLEIPGVAA